jgi:RNA polymerase sigma-70 factor (ECF subfamily)
MIERAHDDRDLELVRQALAGDRSAFDRIVQAELHKVYAKAYRLLGRREDAEDVASQVFLKAWTNRANVKSPDAFYGWLMTITSNESLNLRRARSLRMTRAIDTDAGSAVDAPGSLTLSGESTQATPEPSRVAAGHELGERLADAIASLPERHRQCLLLFKDGTKQDEIARRMKMTVENVKYHVFQARKLLKEQLKDVM